MGFSSRADGSAGLRFTTQELSADDFANFKNEHNAFGWLIFSPNEAEEIPDEDIEEEGISASERLRRRMFVYFKEKVKEGDLPNPVDIEDGEKTMDAILEAYNSLPPGQQ